MLVLKYLNPELEDKDFNNLAYYITNKKNNFITFNIKKKYLIDMLDNLNIDRPPINRKRKVVFNQQTKLTTNEKLQIVGQLIGRSTIIKIEDIYQCMLNLNESNKKITWTAVASLLNCSVRTVYRNLNKELKIEKINLNEEI